MTTTTPTQAPTMQPTDYIRRISTLPLSSPSEMLHMWRLMGEEWLDSPANSDHPERSQMIDALCVVVLMEDIRKDGPARWIVNAKAWIDRKQNALAAYVDQPLPV